MCLPCMWTSEHYILIWLVLPGLIANYISTYCKVIVQYISTYCEVSLPTTQTWAMVLKPILTFWRVLTFILATPGKLTLTFLSPMSIVHMKLYYWKCALIIFMTSNHYAFQNKAKDVIGIIKWCVFFHTHLTLFDTAVLSMYGRLLVLVLLQNIRYWQ